MLLFYIFFEKLAEFSANANDDILICGDLTTLTWDLRWTKYVYWKSLSINLSKKQWPHWWLKSIWFLSITFAYPYLGLDCQHFFLVAVGDIRASWQLILFNFVHSMEGICGLLCLHCPNCQIMNSISYSLDEQRTKNSRYHLAHPNLNFSSRPHFRSRPVASIHYFPFYSFISICLIFLRLSNIPMLST